MTESEWHLCRNVDSMLQHLHGGSPSWRHGTVFHCLEAAPPIPPSERKMRLLACACCRRVWGILRDERCRDAIETAERYADGLAPAWKLVEAEQAARAVVWAANADESSARGAKSAEVWVAKLAGRTPRRELLQEMDARARRAAETHRIVALTQHVANPSTAAAVSETLRAFRHRRSFPEMREADLLRDIFGNPFQPVSIDPRWLRWNDHCVTHIAEVIYKERRFTELCILADALIEAGCDNPAILEHCQSPGHHVRGCWVVDAILGKK